jgi:hypothetical protein
MFKDFLKQFELKKFTNLSMFFFNGTLSTSSLSFFPLPCLPAGPVIDPSFPFPCSSIREEAVAGKPPHVLLASDSFSVQVHHLQEVFRRKQGQPWRPSDG